MTKFSTRLYILSLFALAFQLATGCATVSQTQALRGIAVGMSKSEVLEQVGNPTRTGRHLGQDRWVYAANDESSSAQEIYVFFDQGSVTYVGPAQEPSTQKPKKPSANKNFKIVDDPQ
jgi:hypothetical protein